MEVKWRTTDLETFVLEDLFDGDVLHALWDTEHLCLEDDTKGAIANDFAICI